VYCKKLEKAAKLIPSKDTEAPRALTFGELAKDFWTWGSSEYVATRLRFSDPAKPAISERYVNDCARILELHILPTFRRRHLDAITPQEVEAFALRLRDGGMSGKRVNNVVSCLRVLLAEAFRAGAIPLDPKGKRAIRALGSSTKERERLKREEVLALFAGDSIHTA
jgi:site-specific recombinase XerC